MGHRESVRNKCVRKRGNRSTGSSGKFGGNKAPGTSDEKNSSDDFIKGKKKFRSKLDVWGKRKIFSSDTSDTDVKNSSSDDFVKGKKKVRSKLSVWKKNKIFTSDSSN